MQIFAMLFLCFPWQLEAKENTSTVWTALRLQQRFGDSEQVAQRLASLDKAQSAEAFLRAFITLSQRQGETHIGTLSLALPSTYVLAQLKAALLGFSATPTPFQAVLKSGTERVATVNPASFLAFLDTTPVGLNPINRISTSFFSTCTLASFATPDLSVQQTRAP